MKRYMGDVIARVISQEGTCVAGHGVGDGFVIGPGQGHCCLSRPGKSRSV